MKKFIAFFILASLIVLSGTALAADNALDGQGGVEKGKRHKPDKPRVKFEDCDKANAGSLSFEEARTCFPRMSKKKFDAIDTNQDGKITKEELKAYHTARKKQKKAKTADQ